MIYLDNASTCKPYKEVLETYCKYAENNFFNPSSIYKAGKNNLFLEERIKKEQEDIKRHFENDREE